MELDVGVRSGSARKTRFAWAALGAMAFSVSGLATAGSQFEARQVTGLASFVLAAGQPELALAHIREFRDDGRSLTGNSLDSLSWIEARAFLETGQIAKARVMLEKQLEAEVHRGESALVLGRLALQEGDASGALAHFNTAARLGFGETRQQALYEAAAIALGDDDPDRAGQILASMEPGYWAALGYMNLAAAYSARDLNATRPLVALRVALAMSEQDAVSDRSKALRSQLLLRAGYLSYLQEDHEKAIGFLEQVALDSYHTPRALYLHGLALAARDNHRAAMQSWHRAKKYPLAYPGVEDAWLGMGRGYDLSGYLGQAGEAYLAANASYESERVTLGKLASRIREEGTWKALIEDARGSDTQWFLADSRTLTQPRMAYLLRFMESENAQQAVGRVARLVDLDNELARKAQHPKVFQASLDTRLATDPWVARPQTHALAAKAETLRTRAIALKGRLGQGADQSGFVSAAQTLRDVESGLGSLESRLSERNAHLRSLAQRADSALERVQSLNSRVAGLRKRAEMRLDDVALTFVERQNERMVFALDKTEQQIAHLYEYLALETIERGER